MSPSIAPGSHDGPAGSDGPDPAGSDGPDVLIEMRAAEAAATAARAVPGVVRLQPGLMGLVVQIASEAWERLTGCDLPDAAGVTVSLGRPPSRGLRVELRVVLLLEHGVAATADALRTVVAATVTAAVGHPVDEVVVHVVEVRLPAVLPTG